MPPLPPNATIGIIGGGQLGRMSAIAAAELGYRCHILTPEPDSPAAQVSGHVTLADYEDHDALRAFAAAVDVITFEFENVSAAGLDLLESIRPVRPSPSVLRISQDRVTEKSFLRDAGVPTAAWAAIGSLPELEQAVARIGLPAVLKTTRLGYDGKGQAVLRAPDDLATGLGRTGPQAARARSPSWTMRAKSASWLRAGPMAAGPSSTRPRTSIATASSTSASPLPA